MDFPRGQGVIKEELLVTPSAPAKKAMENLKPVVFYIGENDELPSEIHHNVVAEDLIFRCGSAILSKSSPKTCRNARNSSRSCNEAIRELGLARQYSRA